MYCWKCGKENLETSQYCVACGAKLITEASDDAKLEAPKATAPAVEAIGKNEELPVLINGPQGVEGWLKLLCIGLTILAPIFSIIQAIRLFSISGSSGLFILYAFYLLGIACYSMIIGIHLWMIRPRALQQAKTFLIVVFAANIIMSIIIAAALSAPTVVLTTFFLGAISFVIWWLYLAKSIRVRNTYLSTH